MLTLFHYTISHCFTLSAMPRKGKSKKKNIPLSQLIDREILLDQIGFSLRTKDYSKTFSYSRDIANIFLSISPRT